jgi:hypothetical protein
MKMKISEALSKALTAALAMIRVITMIGERNLLALSNSTTNNFPQEKFFGN